MKEFFALKILDIFKGLYKKMGINYDIMRLIVQSKLVMDSRRVGNISNSGMQGNKEKNTFYSSLIAYVVVGLLSAPILFLNVEPIIKMSFYFGFFMVMILTVFISDFSTVILDVNDKDIIGTKGIDAKTLNAAKITHIFIYISLLSLAISGCSLIVSIRYGIGFFLLFLFSIFFIDIFMIIVTASMYFVILKLFSGEKLKDMLNIFQIIFLLIFTVGYQVVVQSFKFVNLEIIYDPKWWNILLPPIWFASNFSILQGIELNPVIVTLSILSLIIPIISMIIYVKLIPVFESNLQKLNDNTYKNKRSKESFTSKISKIICKDNEERVFFNFVNNILSKDREFKTKVYPSLAMGAFMPFLMIIVSYDGQGINQYLNSIKDTPIFLSAYLGIAISQNVINMIQYSNEFQASWIYDIAPIKNESNIYSATCKACIYKLMLSIFGIIAIGFLLLFKVSIIKHLAVIFLANILVSMFTFKINEKHLPFSIPYKTASTTSDIGVVIKSMLIVGILAGIHFVINSNTLLTWIYALLLIIVIYVLWKNTFKVNKNKS